MADALSRALAPGSPEYAAVFANWVRNGRPYQFDRMDAAGGAIYHCPDYQHAAEPTFFVHAEAGPTEFDETRPGGPSKLGWIVEMLRTGQVEFREKRPETLSPLANS